MAMMAKRWQCYSKVLEARSQEPYPIKGYEKHDFTKDQLTPIMF